MKHTMNIRVWLDAQQNIHREASDYLRHNFVQEGLEVRPHIWIRILQPHAILHCLAIWQQQHTAIQSWKAALQHIYRLASTVARIM